MQRKIIFFMIVFLIALSGFAVGMMLYVTPQHPYQLSYRHIAINIPVTYNHYLKDKKLALGEKYLAESLKMGFVNNGYNAAVYTIEDTYKERHPNSGYELYMRAFPELDNHKFHDSFDSDRIAVLYETIPYNLREVSNADIVFTGSNKKNDEYRTLGINSYFIPQFTSFEDFYPAYNEKYATEILYIANQWPNHPTRQTVVFAQQNDIKIDVYGKNWEDILTNRYATWWKAEQIANDELKYYYSSAKIVLNDIREDMNEAGFINNRVFDVTACKGFLISSYAPQIAEIYGDSVPMYKTSDEFKKLMEYYLQHPEERKEKAEKAYQITKKYFGRDKIIKDMLKIMELYRIEKIISENADEK